MSEPVPINIIKIGDNSLEPLKKSSDRGLEDSWSFMEAKMEANIAKEFLDRSENQAH